MSAPDPYEARHAFFAPAIGAAPLWSIIAGFILVVAAWYSTCWIFIPWAQGEFGTAPRTLGALLTFGVVSASTFQAVRSLQGRDPLALIGRAETALRDLRRAAPAVFAFTIIFYVVFLDWRGVEQAMPVLRWLLLLPFACLAVLIQTSAEEILFRGYLQQGLGARFDHPAVWMVIPSVLFGLWHYNPEIPWDATLAHMIWAFCFGLAAADLTARTGALGASTGLHFAYNLPQFILVAAPGDLSGFSLLNLPLGWAEVPHTPVSLGFQILFLWMVWMVCRIAIRR